MQLKQGEDYAIQLAFLDEAGSPVTLSTATDIIVALFVNNSLQAKYTTVAKAGYGEAVIDSVENHKINVLVKRDQSKNFSLGILKAEAVVTLPDTILGNKAVEQEFEIGSVVKGFLKEEVLTT